MTANPKPPSAAGSRRDPRAPRLPTDRRRLHEWIRRNLYVAVVCDVLDELGYLDQAMHQRLRPLDSAHCTIVGRARTFRWMETHYIVPEDPYGLEIAAMDSLGHDDVAIHSADTSGTIAPWGELMSTLARRNGAAGCVCDALIRDCRKIVKLGFPVFHAGIRPLNSMGRARVMAYDVPVKCGGVLVTPGDLIFADYDGVVVVPARIEAEALRRAAAKVTAENATRRELRKGRTLREVYDEYHTL
jgi:regulator of RNase E activity RraA